MDAIALSIACSLFTKVAGLGIDAWKEADGTWGIGDLSTLKSLVEAGGAVVDAAVKGQQTPALQAREAELVVVAFAEAWRVHWGESRNRAGRPAWYERFIRSESDQTRTEAVRSRILDGLSQLSRPNIALPTSRVTGDPIAHPLYLALWNAFSQERADEYRTGPMFAMDGAERRGFEARFRAAWSEALSSDKGREVREWLAMAPNLRREALRSRLMVEVAGWPRGHLFGGKAAHPTLPALPLGDMYVEPMCRVEIDDEYIGEVEPVRATVRRLTLEHGVVIVTADFGFGKSLTARTLASDLAREWLETDDVPSNRLDYPVFVRCSDDLVVGEVSLEAVLRRSMHRQVKALGHRLALADDGLTPPDLNQRALFLLDGLDEVVLSESQLSAFFQELRDRSSEEHRVVIFSRPDALPVRHKRNGIPVVHLESFSGDTKEPGQVGDWLSRWRALVPGQPAPSIEDLHTRGVADLAATPILLFMVAITWGTIAADPAISRTTLYETFVAQMARGKHEADVGAQNLPILQASEHLRAVLLEREFVPRDAQVPDAMLWLMSRVAWEAMRLEQKPTPEDLERDHVRQLLRDGLKIRDREAIRLIEVGALLALQADLDGDNPRILFGHRSFREFLVAKFWAWSLSRIVDLPEGEKRLGEERVLYGARLLEEDSDQSKAFLVEILQRWPPYRQALVAKWAEHCLHDDRMDTEGAPTALRNDRRAPLRETSLLLAASMGTATISDPMILQGLHAWFAVNARQFKIAAQGLVAPGVSLHSMTAYGAVLSKANLSGANAWHCACMDSDLREADLSSADLTLALLDGCDLTGAVLHEARLNWADLSRVNLTGATVTTANCHHAMFFRAELSGANMSHSDFSNASLRNATAIGTNFENASFRKADLRDANLALSRFAGCDFTDAILFGADLSGADLSGADFRRATLHRTRLDGAQTKGALGISGKKTQTSGSA